MDELDMLGHVQLARDSFLQAFIAKFGRRPRFGYKLADKAYRKIVAICMAKQFNIGDYIVGCMRMTEKDRIYITPNDFTTRQWAERYAAMLKQYGTDAEQEWTSQCTRLTAQQRDTGQSDIGRLLMPLGSSYDAWFRVLYSHCELGIMAVYGKQAWEQMRDRRDLRMLMRRQRGPALTVLEREYGPLD